MIFKSLRTISTRTLTFGSCVIQQSDVGMSIELLAIQLLLFKTRCTLIIWDVSLSRYLIVIQQQVSKFSYARFVYSIAFQHSSVPTLYFCTKVPVSYSPYNKKCTYFTCFNADSYPCRFWYKPLSPHTTLPSTLTAPGSWTAVRAWIMLGRTLPTRTCSPKAKLAVCQGSSFYNGAVISPSESSHLRLRSF